MGYPSGRLEDSSAESYVDYGGPAQEVSAGTILATGIETVFVIFWERIWLLFFFAFVLSLCLRLSLKSFICSEKFMTTS